MDWPDWRGECIAIIASGPTAKKANVGQLRDRIHVVAIKKSVELCPWAEIVYGCDPAWWFHRKGLPDFHGLKLSNDLGACKTFGLQHVDIDRKTDGLLSGGCGRVGSGGNSGFQALNLVVQFGAVGILLVGFDMHGEGAHWYGRNNWLNANNPDRWNFIRWKKAFDFAAPELKKRDIDVVNASPNSELNSFRRATIEQALQDWGL
jgi:hypothetical protein